MLANLEDKLNLSNGGSQIDLDNMFKGNLTPITHYATDNKTISRRHSNISKIRKSARPSSRSDLVGEVNIDRQFKSLKEFLADMFTDQFVNFTSTVKRINQINNINDDPTVQDKFEENKQFLFESNDPLRFPKDFQKRYPFQLREIFDYL